MLSLWCVASLVFGTVFWLITIATEASALRSQPYGLLILVKSFAMLFALLCYMGIRVAIEIAVVGSTSSEAWANSSRMLLSPLMGVTLLYVWLTSVAFSFVRQMSAMVGPRIMVNLLLGKYRQPKVETRIFMFLDLEGSTSIAERLGHEAFCRLIQECFRDLADVGIGRNVEIYQYVGDEAILTWSPALGLEDSNCLRVFFEFEQSLLRRSEFYRDQFGVLPKFKAGANLGPATVAEIGVFKRDIAYLSDVLNTAARLESMCRSHNARLLITEALKEALSETEHLSCELVGDLELRGKSQRVGVYRVEAC